MINSPGTVAVIDEHHLRVGDRTWWGQFRSHDYEGEYEWKMRQFFVRFESKWEVSIVWGYCTYSDNHDRPFYDNSHPFNETPRTVEAAVFHADREGIQPDGEPFGYLDTEQLNALLTAVAGLATDEQIPSRLDDVLPGRPDPAGSDEGDRV